MIIGFGISPSRVKASGGGVSYDTDAEAFFTAASITDNTQKSAVNQLVLDLKSYNIWTKMKALYPIVGGSASSHAVNLKTPVTYNLTFATGVTHSSTGMTGNGTTGYANTGFSPSLLTNASSHFSLYSRTNNAANIADMGTVTLTGYFNINLKWSTNSLFSDQYNQSTNRISVSNATSDGFYISNRSSSIVFKVFKNNAQIGTTNTNSSTPNISTLTNTVFICNSNVNGAPSVGNYSNRQYAFASIGDGLTDTEAANFYTAVQAYQTTLSRQV